MSFIGRQDRMLLTGFAVALVVVFSRQIRQLLDLARQVEQSSGLALVPALIILVVMFMFHQQGKRQESRTQAVAAQAGAIQAEARAAELEELVIFGEALGQTLDLDTIHDVVVQHLHRLAGSDDAWAMMHLDGSWKVLVVAARENRRELESFQEQIADRAVSIHGSGISATSMSVLGHLCVPMIAGGRAVGVLGVPDTAGPFTEGRRRVLAAAAALLGISLRNAQLFLELREHSLRDGLTGCFNHTHALEVVAAELHRARRSKRPVSLVMFDLDHFKAINDEYGHLCGDAVLAAVGVKMRDVGRSSDVRCRYGGEEFLLLLPETPIEGAKNVADTLRRELAELPIHWNGKTLHITASFGVAIAALAELDTKAFVGRADAALYQAKEEGRDCVRLAVEEAAVA
jgi:diguanylate cyclase (GGDEF)-like protein